MQMPSKDDLYGMYQNLSSRVKQYVQNMTPLELKVAEATNSDPWGPHGTVMAGETPRVVHKLAYSLTTHPSIHEYECSLWRTH